MREKIFVEPIEGIPTFKKRFEIVERKGIGHPDTICDLVMNQISIELSKLYIKETGSVQHHNMDKAMLVAGQNEIKFGGGKMLKPMKMILGDRATFEINDRKLPIADFAVNSAKSWFENNLRYVRKKDVEYQVEIGTTSTELQSILRTKSLKSNDTSVLVGYAPFTKTESLVLEAEQYLNSKKFKNEFPESGEDIKVMGFRNKSQIDLTVAMAFVDSFVESESKYFARKHEMLHSLNEFLKSKFDFEIHSAINCLDEQNQGIGGLYLTVLGTSADHADSGEVGRGNMANRVISPSRPASSEATAGKNPVSHIGKIYNVMAFKIADEIQKTITDFDEVIVWMYNIIGRPVSQPKAVVIQPISEKKIEIDAVIKKQATEIVEKNLEKINEFCNNLISGKIDIV